MTKLSGTRKTVTITKENMQRIQKYRANLLLMHDLDLNFTEAVNQIIEAWGYKK